MKKLCLFLSLLLICLSIAACTAQEESPEPTEPSQATEPTESAEPVTTLMIYMVGSDLEAQAGAGTRDLQEMAQSGVDLSAVNVLVYADGSPHWHSEAMPEQKGAVLLLTQDGFSPISDTTAASMGSPETLSAFLNYAYENFPAQQYALILWDHGNGPVMGFGCDINNDQDALTLAEMRQALASSAFGPENKLAWVGFDACLMSSAELACIWADYADYLVASQEVEPSFGWNYSFLSSVGHADTPAVLSGLVESYLQTCEEYYAQKGYDHRDTTLACIDLSKTEQLESSVNALFEAANIDALNNYNALAQRRSQTRALGRASTGSEYDLIDLMDLTQQMADLYPEEAASVQSAVQQMVISNATNASQCCGLSIYFPFFNKYYYENGWQETYRQLGVLDGYQAYLQSFEQIWLKQDKLEDFAASTLPKMVDATRYQLQLTPEQAENLVSAKYYILINHGGNTYSKLYSSSDITNDNGLLTANFDGNVIYAKSNFDGYTIPITQEHDTVDGLTRYSVMLRLTNSAGGTAYVPDGQEHRIADYRLYITCDKATGKIDIGALLPYNPAQDAKVFQGGKLNEDLSDWRSYIFINRSQYYLTRYENGIVMPFDQWIDNGWTGGPRWAIDDGLEFVYEPLTDGEYALIFELQDTQGTRYCSEPIPISPQTVPEQEPAVTQIHWDNGDRKLLLTQDDISLYIKKTESFGEASYTLELENNSDVPVYCTTSSTYLNGNIEGGYFSSLSAEPHETKESPFSMSLGIAVDLGLLDPLENIRFEVELLNYQTGAKLMSDQTIGVQISDDAIIPTPNDYEGYSQIIGPCRDAYATEQLLYEKDGLKVTLLGAGLARRTNNLQLIYKVENTTNNVCYLNSRGGLVINDTTFFHSWPSQVAPHAVRYDFASVSADELDRYGIKTIDRISFLIGGYNQEPELYPVTLAAPGDAPDPMENAVVLYEENGIRLRLLDIHYGFSSWEYTVLIENNTDRHIHLDTKDETVDTEAADIYLSASVAAHTSQIDTISVPYPEGQIPSEISLKLQVENYSQTDLWYISEPFVLPLPEED